MVTEACQLKFHAQAGINFFTLPQYVYRIIDKGKTKFKREVLLMTGLGLGDNIAITIEEGEDRSGLELVKSASDKHPDLLRPSARYYSMFKGNYYVCVQLMPCF